MTFIERHISILAMAIFGMIAIRIFMSAEASSFNIDGFQSGFLQYRKWLTSAAEPANEPDNSLAALISNTIRKQRNGVIGPMLDQDIITGSTGTPTDKKPEPTNSEKAEVAPPATEQKKTQSSGAKESKAENAASGNASDTPLVPASTSHQGDAERTVLERLGLRRSELDKREEEIANREALLQAAEKRLSETEMTSLKKLEADLKARTDQRNAELMSLKPIVTIYETMKPKEAARVFEKLELANLLMVASAMNPRKLSDVLAQMDPALAGKVTKSMGAQNRSTVLPAPIAKADSGNELPDLNPQGTP